MHGTEASVQGFAAGADDFVVKPFSPPELVARIEAQLRLRALQRAVMRMEKETTLGVMAAGIAHEVLNPVNAVLTAMGPLRQRFAKLPEARDREMCEALLEAVEESGGRIRDVVRAMLSLARRDGEDLVLREARLSEGIRSVLTVLGHRASGAVEIESDIAWDEPMQCYPELLFQVVLNLVGNAIDALEERGGRVFIGAERAGDEVRIRIRDDGPGVPPEMRERIFAPFFTTKAPGKGTGLGLAIGREIAALHGGRLELLSPEGGGAEFVLTVPYVSAAGRAALAASAEEPSTDVLH
jgi:signal transduction histidine kinase